VRSAEPADLTISNHKTNSLPKIAFLRASNQVQRNLLLRFQRRDFKTTHYLKLSLTQPGCLEFFCLGHSRVVRCDFIES
jgi:hypothetical protein